MAEEMDNQDAQDLHARSVEVYNALCKAIDNIGYRYEKNDDSLSVSISLQGDDLVIEIAISVNEQLQLIQLFSPGVFLCPEDKLSDMTAAVNNVNCILGEGNFEYDTKYRRVVFKLTESYNNRDVNNEFVKHLLWVLIYVVDLYNDKFFMVSKGVMNPDNLLSIN